MQLVDERLLAARFAATALQLGLTASASYTAGEHVTKGLAAGCEAEARALPGGCRHRACAATLGLLTPGCLRQWEALEAAFLFEVRLALALLVLELAAMLTGLQSAHNEVLNLLGALGHAAGCGAVGLFLLKGSACTLFHVVLAVCNVLPLGCELLAWLALLRGGRPARRFPPPEDLAGLAG
mmetsp:Transcript_107427/g.346695  ORF Transcript_107427/g.346695 Transcript_107427/m.346695 type:complete len:182 (+) Transcript_107427:71-616(+)